MKDKLTMECVVLKGLSFQAMREQGGSLYHRERS